MTRAETWFLLGLWHLWGAGWRKYIPFFFKYSIKGWIKWSLKILSKHFMILWSLRGWVWEMCPSHLAEGLGEENTSLRLEYIYEGVGCGKLILCLEYDIRGWTRASLKIQPSRSVILWPLRGCVGESTSLPWEYDVSEGLGVRNASFHLWGGSQLENKTV